jgi:peptidoglycan/xylan/chitin deacetylase (PgdA/CDA1 family)
VSSWSRASPLLDAVRLTGPSPPVGLLPKVRPRAHPAVALPVCVLYPLTRLLTDYARGAVTENLQPQPRRKAQQRPNTGRNSLFRRRIAALLVVVAVVAAAVAIPIACTGGDETASTSSSTTSTSLAGSSTVDPTTTTTSPSGTVTITRAKEIGANELGRIPVLMYHLIGTGQSYLTPDQLRFHIALLRSHGFYPTTVKEMVEGTMEIPAGKSPVVLTFDDSSPGQYRILDDGTLDPDCAVGILQAEVARGNWAPKATFFPLLDVNQSNVLFGQPQLAHSKLQDLVEWGYEIGSHGMTHLDFSEATAEQVRKELAGSQEQLESLIGNGYKLFTVSPPYGEYPSDRSLLLSGEYEGRTYAYQAVVMAWGESSPSPFSSTFDVTRIPRITAAAPESVKKLLKYWNDHRQLLYISDGDSGTISFPKEAPAELGTLRADLDQRVVEY